MRPVIPPRRLSSARRATACSNSTAIFAKSPSPAALYNVLSITQASSFVRWLAASRACI
jgi:hypothetical protein